MTHGWPETGAGSVSVESLYQAFKARLLVELAAVKPASVNVYIDYKQVDFLPLKERT